jgi:hypothetical protein
MDFFIQIVVIFLIAGILLGSIFYLMRKFKLSNRFFFLISIPLILFVIGFILRLSVDKSIVDIGFFFTEINYVFVYAIFATAWLLGQSKYHKVVL